MADREVSVKITTDATAAIAGIQKFLSEMKTVGTKTDAEFDALRQHLQKTYASISQSATASANEIRRAQETTAAKISTLNKQQYGEQTSMLSTLKANWIAATAVIYAAISIIKKGWDLAEGAATFEEIESGLQGLAAKYGMTADSAIQMAKSAVNGQLSMVEAGKLAAKAFALGFDPKQVAEFLTEAEKLSHVMGGTIPEAFDAMERAAATGRKGGLVGLGITVDLKQAVADYADKMGIAKESISAHLQMQIRANAIMEAAKKVTDQLGEAYESTGVKMAQTRAVLEDAQLLMGQIIIRFGAFTVGIADWIVTLGASITFAFAEVGKGFYGLLSKIPILGTAYKDLYAESSAAAAANLAIIKGSAAMGLDSIVAAFASKETLSKRTMKLQDDETEHFKAAKGVESAVLKSAMDVAKNTYETAASAAKEAYEKTASAADFASRKEILLGRNVLASELDVIKIKQDARATELQTDLDARKTELDTEIKAINSSTELAEIKKAKLLDLESKYILDKQKLQTSAAKDEQKLEQDRSLKLIEIQQTTLKSAIKSAMDVAKNTYETAASAAKEAYEKTASAADFASRKEILLGRNVLASELDAIKIKQDAKATELQTDLDARKTEYDTEIKAINASTELEAIKNAKLLDLKSKFELDNQKIQTSAAKDEQKLAQDNALKLIEIQQTTLAGGLKKGFDDIAKDYSNVGKSMTEVTTTAFSDMTSALVDFVKTGKLNFESLIDNMITGILRLMIQEQLAGLAKSGSGLLSGLFVGGGADPALGADTHVGGVEFHSGGVVSGGNVIPFSRGGIVNRPTIFPMARGAGLMGEAGPEAVMPLTRLAGGDLGVRAVGGGGGEVTVNIINNAGAQVTQTQKETPRGLEIDVMIDQLVAKKLSQRGSSSNRTIRSNFGARETLIAR